jgi:hypothetical protein
MLAGLKTKFCTTEGVFTFISFPFFGVNYRRAARLKKPVIVFAGFLLDSFLVSFETFLNPYITKHAADRFVLKSVPSKIHFIIH